MKVIGLARRRSYLGRRSCALLTALCAIGVLAINEDQAAAATCTTRTKS